MFGYSCFNFSKWAIEITGFLKKLPLLPISFGSGNLDCLIAITASETSLIDGFFMFLEANSFSIAPY